MTPEQIESMRDKIKLTGPEFWLSEIAFQLSMVRQALQQIAGKTPLPVVKRTARSVRTRRYYVTEHLPTLPPKFDRVSCEKPPDGVWHHELTAHSKEDAIQKLTTRLTRERKEAEERSSGEAA